jgi:hypothetical protein
LQEEDKNVAGIAASEFLLSPFSPMTSRSKLISFFAFLSDWESIEHQKKWPESKEYDETTKMLESITAGALYEDVVNCPADAGPSLSAPVVELVSWIHHTSNID